MTHGLHGPVLEDASARCLSVCGAEAASTRSRFYSAATNDFAPDMEMKDMTIAFGPKY